MLKKEVIIANAVLAGLTEEQITAIETLSANDENTVIASKISDIASRIEATTLEKTGIPKNPGEKYYDYNARAMGEVKAGSGGSSAEIEAKEAEIKRLKSELAKGGDSASKATIDDLTTRLADEEKRVTELRQSLQDKEKEYSKELSARDDQFTRTEFERSWNQAVAGLERKPGLDEKTFEELAQSRFERAVSKYGRKLEKTADGTVLRLVDDNGLTVNNPANNLNPMTVNELAMQTVGDLYQGKRVAEGGGTQPSGGDPKPAATGPIQVSGAKTQTEVTEGINTALKARGIATNHPGYQEKFDEAFKANITEGMPLQ